jgi:hypothetical protein
MINFIELMFAKAFLRSASEDGNERKSTLSKLAGRKGITIDCSPSLSGFSFASSLRLV